MFRVKRHLVTWTWTSSLLPGEDGEGRVESIDFWPAAMDLVPNSYLTAMTVVPVTAGECRVISNVSLEESTVCNKGTALHASHANPNY